MQVDIIH